MRILNSGNGVSEGSLTFDTGTKISLGLQPIRLRLTKSRISDFRPGRWGFRLAILAPSYSMTAVCGCEQFLCDVFTWLLL